MSVRDRRRMGVNLLSCLRAAREVMTDSEFEAGSPKDLAQAILERIQGRNFQQLREADPSVDWDSIIAFIEKLLPLILKLLALFGI